MEDIVYALGPIFSTLEILRLGTPHTSDASFNWLHVVPLFKNLTKFHALSMGCIIWNYEPLLYIPPPKLVTLEIDVPAVYSMKNFVESLLKVIKEESLSRPFPKRLVFSGSKQDRELDQDLYLEIITEELVEVGL